MRSAVLAQVAPSGTIRLLADVRALTGYGLDDRAPVLVRLEEELGPELADRLIAALGGPPLEPS
jgi:hypothetical protein